MNHSELHRPDHGSENTSLCEQHPLQVILPRTAVAGGGGGGDPAANVSLYVDVARKCDDLF